jgi:hypothetical protein
VCAIAHSAPKAEATPHAILRPRREGAPALRREGPQYSLHRHAIGDDVSRRPPTDFSDGEHGAVVGIRHSADGVL